MMEHNQKMGIGVVLRDCDGNVLACLCSPKPFFSQPIVAEAWALWRVFIFCSKLGIEKAQFKGDAQVLINAINGKDACSA